MLLGCHVLKSWSSTQASVSLSSGEAEFYALITGASEGFGLVSMAQDFGVLLKLVLHSDATTGLSLAQRHGLNSRIKHLHTNLLWLQEKVQRGEVTLKKVDTKENPADLLTKPLDSTKFGHFVRRHLGITDYS